MEYGAAQRVDIIDNTFKNLPENIREWIKSKYAVEGISILLLQDKDMLEWFEKEKNLNKPVDALMQEREEKIRRVSNFRNNIRKITSQLAIESGFAQDDFEVELKIKNQKLEGESVTNSENFLGVYEIETDFDENLDNLFEKTGIHGWKPKKGWAVWDLDARNFVTSRKGKIKEKVYLMRIDFRGEASFCNPENATKRLRQKFGLRPAELHELVAFCIKYPSQLMGKKDLDRGINNEIYACGSQYYSLDPPESPFKTYAIPCIYNDNGRLCIGTSCGTISEPLLFLMVGEPQ